MLGLELDSGSSVGGSLPSPGAASCSLDAASTSTSPSCALMEHAPSPAATVSSASVNTVQPTGPVGEPPLTQRVGVLQQRVSTRNWSRQKHTSCLRTWIRLRVSVWHCCWIWKPAFSFSPFSPYCLLSLLIFQLSCFLLSSPFCYSLLSFLPPCFLLSSLSWNRPHVFILNVSSR